MSEAAVTKLEDRSDHNSAPSPHGDLAPWMEALVVLSLAAEIENAVDMYVEEFTDELHKRFLRA